MTDTQPAAFVALIGAAARALKDKREEVNVLNVFPVPDGDTGTNMSLTMDAVMAEVDRLPAEASLAEVCHCVQHGSLMGARGNSGVILSQILRGLCEVLATAEVVDAPLVAAAFERSVVVAFQAVRKPVEGTMLTVLRDAAAGATAAAEEGSDITGVLDRIVDEAYASVRRTPELLPVLAEAGVVDAGGYGLAVLMDGMASALEGREIHSVDVSVASTPAHDLASVTPVDDWDDDEYLYCTEFLLFGEGLDRDAVHEYVSARGGSELVVGDETALKVHVHTDDPGSVLSHATTLGQVAEVHVHNMKKQTEARAEGLRESAAKPSKALGFVAVAAGEGLAGILTSLGVDRIISGGQTMNPATADILDAIAKVDAETVIVLPNNKNIIMAAQQAVPVSPKRVEIIPTTSVPQSFAAMLAAEGEESVEDTVAAMTRAASTVRTGEITTAVRDSKGRCGKIAKGQIIGLAEHEIEVCGSDVADVAADLLDVIADGGETLTLLPGSEMSDEEAEAIAIRLGAAHPELEVEWHRGDQPLYPLIMAVE